jgi:predicted nucleic-acid-binding Zn-ribbon protein
MKRKQCPKCNSGKVMHNVRVIDRNGEYQDMNLSVRVERKPDALLFKGAKDFELKALICGDCGYAELYAADPGRLWQVYLSCEGSDDPQTK